MTYDALFAREPATELRAVIAGRAYEDKDICGFRLSGGLYHDKGPGVGGRGSRQLDLSLLSPGIIPRMAEVKLFYRLVLRSAVTGEVTEASAWWPKGVYFIDTRTPDEETGALTLHCYDAMMKMEQYLLPALAAEVQRGGTVELTAPGVMRMICRAIGVELDPRTVLNPDYLIGPRDEEGKVSFDSDEAQNAFLLLRMRRVAGWIAAMHGGNWTVTDEGKLYLAPLIPPGDVVYTVLGDENGNILEFPGGFALSLYEVPESDAETPVYILTEHNTASASLPGALAPWSGVRYVYNNETLAFAGDESGLVLEAECPWPTEAMANAVLGQIAGHVYRPHSAAGALLDPAAELGDMLVLDGQESVLASFTADCDGLWVCETAAPAVGEVDHEFPYVPDIPLSTQRAITAAAQAAKADVLKTVGTTGRTVALDFSNLIGDGKTASGWFTEKIEGDETLYRFDVSVTMGYSGYIITCPDGKTMTVTVQPGTV